MATVVRMATLEWQQWNGIGEWQHWRMDLMNGVKHWNGNNGKDGFDELSVKRWQTWIGNSGMATGEWKQCISNVE
jgi:hypothetical protein